MSKTMLNFKIDTKLKKELQKTAGIMGLPVSALLSNAAKEIVDRKSVTFQAPLIPNAKTGRILKKAIADIKAGRNLSPVFHTAEEMIAYLNK